MLTPWNFTRNFFENALIDSFTILPSLRQLCQVPDPNVVFPKLSLVASYSVLCKMGRGVISLLWLLSSWWNVSNLKLSSFSSTPLTFDFLLDWKWWSSSGSKLNGIITQNSDRATLIPLALSLAPSLFSHLSPTTESLSLSFHLLLAFFSLDPKSGNQAHLLEVLFHSINANIQNEIWFWIKDIDWISVSPWALKTFWQQPLPVLLDLIFYYLFCIKPNGQIISPRGQSVQNVNIWENYT